MNRAEALSEIERRWPESAELVDLVRRLSRGGRPRKQLPHDERRLAILNAIRAELRKGPMTTSELYRAIKHIGKAPQLAEALLDLEIGDEIYKEQDRTRPGRPVTHYALK